MNVQLLMERETPRENVGRTERLVSALGGAALVLAGLRRRGGAGAALVLGGGMLLQRGVTGSCMVYRALGVNTAGTADADDFGPAVRTVSAAAVRTIECAPVEVYRFWRDVESAPRYQLRVRSVRRTGPTRSRWTAEGLFGRAWTWESEITADRPGEYLAWESLPGADLPNAGTATFRPVPGEPNRTELRVTMRIDPPLGLIGDALGGPISGVLEEMLREDLRRFKQLVEVGEIATTEGQPSGREDGAEESTASAGARP